MLIACKMPISSCDFSIGSVPSFPAILEGSEIYPPTFRNDTFLKTGNEKWNFFENRSTNVSFPVEYGENHTSNPCSRKK